MAAPPASMASPRQGVSLATIVLNNIEDVKYAWFIVLIGAFVIALMSLPAVFGMPSSPNPAASIKRTSH